MSTFERSLPAWHSPDIPTAEIKRIVAEREFGNNDIYDMLTRVFACVFFNDSLPQNYLIMRDEIPIDGKKTFYTKNDGRWCSMDAELATQSLVTIFLPIIGFELPADFELSKAQQQFSTIIDKGPRTFGYTADIFRHLKYVQIIKQRHGEGATYNRNIVNITTDRTHIEIVKADDWVQGYERLLKVNSVRAMYYNSRLYLYDTEDMSGTSRATMMRTLTDIKTAPFISVYFLDETGCERCILNAENY